MRPEISVLLLDVDGVLVRGKLASQYFEEKYGLSHEMTIDFYKGALQEATVGKVDMFDILPAYLKRWGWPKTIDEFVQEWFDYENHVDADLIAYVQQLRGRGMRCYVATNQERHRAEYLLDHMGMRDAFDGMFVSHRLGYKKPDPEYFRAVLKKLQVDPKHVLFWDDSESHVTGAREAGVHAEVYTDFGDFKTKMADTYDIQV